MQDLKDRRNSPDYINFIVVGESLRILGEGLRHYAEEKAKELQDMLLKTFPGGKCNCLCVTPGERPCRHTCKWGKVLENLLKNKKKSRIPFHQSDFTQWHDPKNGFWEIAKVFMNDLGPNSQNVKDPATTDLTGLLNFLIFCKHFKVDENLLKSVRALRNKWAHSTSLLLTESEKQAAFVNIENLLNDNELLPFQVLQDCCRGIEEVKTSEVSIVQEKDFLVLAEFIQLKEMEKDRKTEKELKELNERIELMLSSSNNCSCSSAYTYSSFTHVTLDGVMFIAFLFLYVLIEMFTKFSRRLLPFIVVVVMLISQVGDDSVYLSHDEGCGRRTKTSPADPFGFSEFDFHTHLSQKRKNFLGRSWFFRELDDIFENISAPVGVLITGDPGSGKSAILSQLICSPLTSLAIHDNIIGYHLCDYSEREKQNGALFVRNLVAQIASHISEYAKHIVDKKQIRATLDKRCERDPTACFFAAIIGPLSRLKMSLESFKYIVIDALDECVEKDGETSPILEMLHYKMRYFPQWLKIIMTSRNGTIVHSKVPRTVQRISLNSTDERNIEDIRFYIASFLRKRFSFMSRVWKTPIAVAEELTAHRDGNFLFVKTVLQNNIKGDGTINLHSLPNSLHDIYSQVVQRYFVKKDSVRLEILFETLLAAGSLHETDIVDILQREDQTKDMPTIFAHVSSLLHFDKDGLISIYHQSFAEWLTNNDHRIDGFTIQKRRGHAYVANFLVHRARRKNHNISFNELSRLCFHILYSEGSIDAYKEDLKLLNVTKLRNQQNGKSILHELAQEQNSSCLLEIFLPSFVNIDILDFAEKTPAFYAASKGHFENVKIFLSRGICANCVLNSVYSLNEVKTAMQIKQHKELSVIHVATYNGYTNVVDLLLKHNSSFLKFNEYLPSLLNVAAERGHLDLVKLLHNYGAEVDAISLHHAASKNNFLIVKYLLETAGAEDECLECKSSRPIIRSKKSLREVHDMFCETALHAAVSKGHINISKLLLQFGNSAVDCKHFSGKTPLMDAAERNDTKMVQLLLENGANVEEKCGEENLVSFGEPRTFSVRSFHEKRFLYTIYREKTSCACGNKALHLCAKYGLWHMAKYLINNWYASVLDKNCKGETVWKIANISHNEDFIYHVTRTLLNLDETKAASEGKYRKMGFHLRRTFEKLLKKFSLKTKPYQSSFQCDSTFEGMSPLHIAALMGMKMLKQVYTRAQKKTPSLLLNCTNKHWIVPEYLAYFYDSISVLPSHANHSPRSKNDFTETSLQYPDREAEFHLIYNYFYHSPTNTQIAHIYEIFEQLEHLGIENCPGYYNIPTQEDLTPSCDRYDSESETESKTTDLPHSTSDTMLQKRDGDCECFYEFVVIECNDATTELEKVEFNKRAFRSAVEEFREKMMWEGYMNDCGCPRIMSILQMIFTVSEKRDRFINQFIAERMDWKDTSPDGEILKRWPSYFFRKKLRNEYQSYKYLEILNEGFQLKLQKTLDDY